MRIKASAYEAKTHLSRLLDSVERGDTVIITRHGVPVAALVPPTEPERPDPRNVIERIRASRRGVKLGDITLEDAIRQGRR